MIRQLSALTLLAIGGLAVAPRSYFGKQESSSSQPTLSSSQSSGTGEFSAPPSADNLSSDDAQAAHRINYYYDGSAWVAGGTTQGGFIPASNLSIEQVRSAEIRYHEEMRRFEHMRAEERAMETRRLQERLYFEEHRQALEHRYAEERRIATERHIAEERHFAEERRFEEQRRTEFRNEYHRTEPLAYNEHRPGFNPYFHPTEFHEHTEYRPPGLVIPHSEYHNPLATGTGGGVHPEYHSPLNIQVQNHQAPRFEYHSPLTQGPTQTVNHPIVHTTTTGGPVVTTSYHPVTQAPVSHPVVIQHSAPPTTVTTVTH